MKLKQLIEQLLEEEKKKRDRCLRIADRKFDKPSAYKSGAVVRCRRGEIWKGLKETDDPQSGKAAPYGSGYARVKEIIQKILKENEIVEGKQVGILYHNTSIKKAIQIIKTNKLKTKLDTEHIFTDYRNKDEDFIFIMGHPVHKDYLEGKIKAFISFTRNKNYRRVEDNVQFILDGDKLSENYKISPYSHFGGRSYDEMEERIYKDIDDLQKYIIKVVIPNNNPELESALKEKNIPYEVKLNEDESLHKWFKRKGTPGKEGGWVDCNTCRDGKCKPCGRKEGENRAKYPSCRPTPAQCKTKGKGKKWGKTK
jgi:hypothetical protein